MVKQNITMKFCPMVECAKVTPHSYDDGSKQVECDGACSVRRQEEWRLSVQKARQPKPEPKPKPEYKLVIPPEYSHMTAEEYEEYLRSFLWEA